MAPHFLQHPRGDHLVDPIVLRHQNFQPGEIRADGLLRYRLGSVRNAGREGELESTPPGDPAFQPGFEEGDAWMANAIVSTIAFPFWAYLMGAVAFSRFHDGNLAAILILTFTAVSGLVAPAADVPKAVDQINSNPKEGPRLVENAKA